MVMSGTSKTLATKTRVRDLTDPHLVRMDMAELMAGENEYKEDGWLVNDPIENEEEALAELRRMIKSREGVFKTTTRAQNKK